MNDLLTVSNLSKTYYSESGEIQAIENFNLNVKDGEIIAIVGSSGCGKSTLLSILANLEDKTNGDINFKIKNPKIGYMLQQDALFPWLNILNNALLGLKISKDKSLESKNYVEYLLTTYGLKDFLDKYPNELSGGMRQRVGCLL